MTTVSLCFQEGSRISGKTRKKVLEAAREIGYVPNQFARRLRSGKSRLIGLVVTEADTAFVADIIAGVEQTVAAKGYNVLVFSTYRDINTERNVVRAAYEMMAEGLIVAACEEQNSVLQHLSEIDYPIVYVDSVPPGSKGAYVTDATDTITATGELTNEPVQFSAYVINDMEAIARLGIEHLLSLGHKDILIINGQEMYKNFSSFSRLENAYRSVYEQNGIKVREELLRYGGAYIKDGCSTICRVLDEGIKFSAVFAISDMVALGVIEGLERRGLRVPNDVSVIGVDDSEVSSLKRIGLTTISTCQNDSGKQNMGVIAANMLMEMLIPENSQTQIQNVILKPNLILRDSCKVYKPHK